MDEIVTTLIRCSFCGKNRREALQIFASDTARICDQCVVRFYSQLPGPFPLAMPPSPAVAGLKGKVVDLFDPAADPETSTPQPDRGRLAVDPATYEARSRAALILTEADGEAQEILRQARDAYRYIIEEARQKVDKAKGTDP